MKGILLSFVAFFSCFFAARAQTTLWESLPLDFNEKPWVIYYDAVEDASYVGGTFTTVGDSACNVVRIDENGYTLLPFSPLGTQYDMLRYDDKLYVSGSGGLVSWDGNDWTFIDSINDVGSMTLHEGHIWAVVNMNTDTGTLRTVARWNDTFWINTYRADTLVGEWTIRDLVFFQGELYIAGNLNPSDYPEIKEIARFDGTRWRDVGEFQSNALASVWRLVVWNDTLYVGGQFDEISGSPGNGIAKWDGQQWHRLNNGVWQGGGPAITDIAVFNNELYVTGWFYIVDGINQGYDDWTSKGFAKWDGSRWCTLGTAASNVMVTMGNFRDELYIMGGFDSMNNEPMNRMAKWIGGDYADSCSEAGVGIDELNVSNHQYSLQLFPNPASAELTLQFKQEHPGSVGLAIKDIAGRTVRREAPRYYNEGEKKLELDVSSLVPGMYLVTLYGETFRQSQKLVIQR